MRELFERVGLVLSRGFHVVLALRTAVERWRSVFLGSTFCVESGDRSWIRHLRWSFLWGRPGCADRLEWVVGEPAGRRGTGGWDVDDCVEVTRVIGFSVGTVLICF